ncbi:ribbon-helix-helix protein, CopG family [Nitriliruptoraceae bacterium ZYF776]|nr:ribbon-helix-helix protein, CopG family [Profundirhabdus halotolerans]
MSMSKDRRLQVLLEDEQYRSIEALARERHVSVATVVREALSRYLTAGPEQVRTAAARILSADPMPVGDPDEVRAELEELRARRR